MAKKKSGAKAAPKKESVQRKSKKKNHFFKYAAYPFIGIWWIFKGIYLALKYFFKGLYWLSDKIVSFFLKEKKLKSLGNVLGKGKLKDTEKISKIKVLETIKGSYPALFDKLKKSDSMIGIIVGARGSGKSAIAMSLLENLKGSGKKFLAMGFQSKDLPEWIKVIEAVDEIENDSYIVIDEGGILFSSRDSMSNSNKLLSELLFIARHKNLTILFISQNSSNIEINTIRQADFIILKKSSLLQKDFERKKIAEIYTEYAEGFDKYKNNKGLTLVYSDQFVGFIDNELPSFWSAGASKGFRNSAK
jgi:hypothetical protein